VIVMDRMLYARNGDALDDVIGRLVVFCFFFALWCRLGQCDTGGKCTAKMVPCRPPPEVSLIAAP